MKQPADLDPETRAIGYPRGVTNKDFVIGHWFGDQRQFGDRVGAGAPCCRHLDLLARRKSSTSVDLRPKPVAALPQDMRSWSNVADDLYAYVTGEGGLTI